MMSGFSGSTCISQSWTSVRPLLVTGYVTRLGARPHVSDCYSVLCVVTGWAQLGVRRFVLRCVCFLCHKMSANKQSYNILHQRQQAPNEQSYENGCCGVNLYAAKPASSE